MCVSRIVAADPSSLFPLPLVLSCSEGNGGLAVNSDEERRSRVKDPEMEGLLLGYGLWKTQCHA